MYLYITHCTRSNLRGIQILCLLHTKFIQIFAVKVTPHAEEIIGDHSCGFRRKRSPTDHNIICIGQILEKKWEYNEPVHQLFIDIKKAYDSVRREDLYNILVQIGILMKLVRLIKIGQMKPTVQLG